MKLTSALAGSSLILGVPITRGAAPNYRSRRRGGSSCTLGGSVKTCSVPPATDCSCADESSTNVECVKLEKDGAVRQEWCADFDEGV